MTLASEHDHISWSSDLACELDSQCPFRNDEEFFAELFARDRGSELLKNRESIFGVRIIIGSDQDITVFVSDLSHDRSLGSIPIASCSEKGDQSARSFDGLEIVERFFQCIRGMGEIHEIMGIVFFYMIHASDHSLEGCYSGYRVFDPYADLDYDAQCGEDVIDIESADKFGLHLIGLAEIGEREGRSCGSNIDVLCLES